MACVGKNKYSNTIPAATENCVHRDDQRIDCRRSEMNKIKKITNAHRIVYTVQRKSIL